MRPGDPGYEIKVFLETVTINGVTYEEGSEVDGCGLPEEEVQTLRGAGKIGKISPTGNA